MRLHSRWRAVAASTLLLFAACDDQPNGPSPVPAPTSSEPVTITSIHPTNGFAGQEVIVNGTGFVAGARVTFDGVLASKVFVRSTSVTATIPLHPGGLVDVVVTNPDGRSDARAGGFTYMTVTLTVSANPVRPGSVTSWKTGSSTSLVLRSPSDRGASGPGPANLFFSAPAINSSSFHA